MTTVFEQTEQPNDSDVGSATRIGEEINNTSSLLYNLLYSDIQFYLGNPAGNPGTTTCGIFNGTTLKHTFWTKANSTLPASRTLTSETTTPSSTETIVGDYIGCISSDDIKMGIKLGDVFDGVNTSWTYNGSTNTGYDCGFKFTVTDEPPPPTGTFLPPPPAMVRL